MGRRTCRRALRTDPFAPRSDPDFVLHRRGDPWGTVCPQGPGAPEGISRCMSRIDRARVRCRGVG